MVKELKHTEIGDIPVDWELQTFDETFRVISNNTLSRENLNNRGGAVRNIHYGDILTKFPEVLDCNEEEIPYVNELSLLSSSTQLLQDGDIVVADTAEDETVGKVIEVQNLGDSKLVAGLHTIPCRVKKGDFAPGWLGYYMNSDLFHNQILPYITGIKVSSISKGAISETLILVPPFDEQEKIVQSLNKIQLLMTSETKVVNKIKLVKNGCLSKMFPQKDDTVPEMRLPGFTEAWEQRKFSEGVSEIGDGLHGTPIYCEDGNVYFINGNNLVDGKIVISAETKKVNESQQSTADKSLDDTTILMSINGTIGNLAYYSGERLMLGKSAAYIKVSEFDKRFVYAYLQAPSVQEYFMDSLTGTTIKNLGLKAIREMIMFIPQDVDEQKRIGKFLDYLDHLITLHQCKCDKYSNIKKGMMSDLLTGKIRLV